MRYSPTIVWTVWIVYFLVFEGVGVYHEVRDKGGDVWTFTHYFASHMPMSLRVALLAWLAYHFLIQHIRG